jgi:cell division protein FtsN
MAKAKPKKKSVSRNRKPSPRRSAPLWVIIILVIAIAMFAAFLWFLKTHYGNNTPPAEPSIATQKPAKTPSQKKDRANSAAEKTSGQEEPRYDFYTLLPNQAVMSNGKPNPLNNPRPVPRFALQAGAFKNSEEADKRRAELLLLGMQVIVQPAKTGDPYYRVLIGPFNQKIEAEKAHKSLETSGVETILIKQ